MEESVEEGWVQALEKDGPETSRQDGLGPRARAEDKETWKQESQLFMKLWTMKVLSERKVQKETA